jgi:Cdc6-like AAA superfamily ATPase
LKIHFYYRHVNCIRYRTVYSIFISVIQSFVPEFPIRGFSTFELIKYLKEYLEASNSYLLLTLDDIDALNGDKDYDTILISLINNEIENFDIYKKRISLVIISNNKMYLNSINNLSASQLLQNIIFFQSYSREQLYYILIFRAQETLIEQTWTENDIEKIIQIVEEQNYGFYDPRIGLEILWRVARESEANKKSKLTVDNFKFYDKVPFEDSKIELSLKIQEKVLLYIIAKIFLKNQNQSFTTIKEIKREFDKIKASLKIPFTKLGYTSIFNYLQELKKLNLIITQVTNAQTRGRSTIIKLNILPNHVDVLLQNQLLK